MGQVARENVERGRGNAQRKRERNAEKTSNGAEERGRKDVRSRGKRCVGKRQKGCRKGGRKDVEKGRKRRRKGGGRGA